MGVGDIVSAARYNTIQGRISALLGPGSGDRGYNNTVSSFAVPVGSEVTVAHMNNLKTDYTAIYVHLFGSLPGGLIAENVSTRVKTGETGLIWDDLYAEYESQIVNLETNRFTIDADYAAVESSGINSTRSTVWGGTALPQFITHEFTVSFTTANARRGFFNAGGEIRFSANLTHSLGPTDPDYLKTVDWAAMLTAMRTVKFGYTSTDSFDSNGTLEDVSDDTATGAGTGTSIGNLDLTSSYQTLYTKTGSGVYSDNVYTIQAKLDNDARIRFLITFNDGDVGTGGADERVNGTLTSSVSHLRADGGIYVTNPAPAYGLISSL
jgi:hypothetical protein